MFFISKLLPLFVYPLGLSSLLIGLGLLWLWRYPRRATWAIALALFILFFSSNPTISNRLVSTLEWRYFPPDPMPTAEAIVVLGGATVPALAPRPWVEVSERGDRILYAARLYRQQRAPKLILSGGRVSWRGDSSDVYRSSEASDMREFALAMNVPESAMILEGNSLNTRQNAVNVQRILQQESIETVLLVTSALHMPRAVAIFQKLGIDVIPAPTDYLVSTEKRGGITWQGQILSLIPETRAIDHFTQALKEYIGFGVYRLRGWV